MESQPRKPARPASTEPPIKPGEPASPTGRWSVYGCKQGVRVQGPGPVSAAVDSSRAIKPLFLPSRATTDDPDLQELPLLHLEEDEVADLVQLERSRGLAATHYGPPQDKDHNQDFALVAELRDVDGSPWHFAAVADGVTTKTFWPARSARITSLVAFRTVRSFLQECSPDGTEGMLVELRRRLSQDLRSALDDDQKEIARHPDQTPKDWNGETYRSVNQNRAFWYNTTLLVACLGPARGFLIWAGDGGIRLLKVPRSGRAELTTVLESTPSLEIDSYVSLSVSSESFRAAWIGYPNEGGLGQVTVVLATDGVDRTLQRSGGTYQELIGSGSKDLTTALERLAALPVAERDNFGLAWIASPSLAQLKRSTPAEPSEEIDRERPKTSLDSPAQEEIDPPPTSPPQTISSYEDNSGQPTKNPTALEQILLSQRSISKILILVGLAASVGMALLLAFIGPSASKGWFGTSVQPSQGVASLSGRLVAWRLSGEEVAQITENKLTLELLEKLGSWGSKALASPQFVCATVQSPQPVDSRELEARLTHLVVLMNRPYPVFPTSLTRQRSENQAVRICITPPASPTAK
jgi:hypothetical protein